MDPDGLVSLPARSLPVWSWCQGHAIFSLLYCGHLQELPGPCPPAGLILDAPHGGAAAEVLFPGVYLKPPLVESAGGEGVFPTPS